MATVQRIPAGTRGFDCNTVVTSAAALAFSQLGYRFAVRYVRRASTARNDLSALEVAALHHAGLAVMPVQHVDPLSEGAGWIPTRTKGTAYGQAAVAGAQSAGVPRGVTVWLDLEGVALSTPAADTIAFCNAWYDAVAAAGYEPGVYVGWRAGLNASDLYYRLKFARYWAAYNLNRDQVPAVRGVCMRQGVALPGDIPAGVSFPIDTDAVMADALGGLPAAYAPDEWDVGGVPWGQEEPDAPVPATPTPGGLPDIINGGTPALVLIGLLIAGALTFAIRRRVR